MAVPFLVLASRSAAPAPSRRAGAAPRARAAGSAAGAAAGADPFDRAANVATVLVVVALLAVLAAQAGLARFYSDEGFHAWVARWIAEHGRLPRVIPELYSGYAYAYPPGFHVLGALWAKTLGLAALPWLNVAVTAVTFLVLGLGPPRAIGPAPRRWAALLVAGNAAIAAYALRFYAEALVALLATAAAVLLLRLRAGGRLTAIGLGAVLGLGVATKFTGLLLLLPVVLSGIAWVRRGERAAAGRAALALAVAALVAAPALIRNQVLFGSALYPMWAPDLDRAMYALHLARFGAPAAAFYRLVLQTFGLTVAAAVLGLAVARARRRSGMETFLLAFGIAAVVVAPAMPVHDLRHVLPLVPWLALLGSAALAPECRPWLRRTLDVVLLAAAAYTLWDVRGMRAELNPPAPLEEAYRAVAAHVPAGGTVLSLWTYDTFYHSGRAATWPIPWGQASRPIEPFQTTDPATLVEALDRHRIDAVLAPIQSQAASFDGSNYPQSMLTTLGRALERGELRLAWQNPQLALVVRARAPAAPSPER